MNYYTRTQAGSAITFNFWHDDNLSRRLLHFCLIGPRQLKMNPDAMPEWPELVPLWNLHSQSPDAFEQAILNLGFVCYGNISPIRSFYRYRGKWSLAMNIEREPADVLAIVQPVPNDSALKTNLYFYPGGQIRSQCMLDWQFLHLLADVFAQVAGTDPPTIDAFIDALLTCGFVDTTEKDEV